MARSHRIGQTRVVKVFRLVTCNSYEQELVHSANRKLGLERAISSSDSSSRGATSTHDAPRDRAEIDRMLRCGAQDISLDDDAAFRRFSEADIDTILQSSTSVDKSAPAGTRHALNPRLRSRAEALIPTVTRSRAHPHPHPRPHSYPYPHPYPRPCPRPRPRPRLPNPEPDPKHCPYHLRLCSLSSLVCVITIHQASSRVARSDSKTFRSTSRSLFATRLLRGAPSLVLSDSNPAGAPIACS